MSDVDKLRAWVEEEKKRGLVDIRFFPGSTNPVSIEDAAGAVLLAVTSNDSIDVTEESL